MVGKGPSEGSFIPAAGLRPRYLGRGPVCACISEPPPGKDLVIYLSSRYALATMRSLGFRKGFVKIILSSEIRNIN